MKKQKYEMQYLQDAHENVAIRTQHEVLFFFLLGLLIHQLLHQNEQTSI
jgi:hypothetical protein